VALRYLIGVGRSVVRRLGDTVAQAEDTIAAALQAMLTGFSRHQIESVINDA
jgi:hypothetical protein